MDMLTSLIVIIVFQHICLSYHHVVHLKLIPCYMIIISHQKLGKIFLSVLFHMDIWLAVALWFFINNSTIQLKTSEHWKNLIHIYLPTIYTSLSVTPSSLAPLSPAMGWIPFGLFLGHPISPCSRFSTENPIPHFKFPGPNIVPELQNAFNKCLVESRKVTPWLYEHWTPGANRRLTVFPLYAFQWFSSATSLKPHHHRNMFFFFNGLLFEIFIKNKMQKGQ